MFVSLFSLHFMLLSTLLYTEITSVKCKKKL